MTLVVAVLGTAFFAVPARSADFFGLTDQHHRVKFGTDRHAELTYFSIWYAARCDNGTSMRSYDDLVIKAIEVSVPNRFIDREAFRFGAPRGMFHVYARTAARRAPNGRWTGYFKARITQSWRGETVRRCYTGPVRFSLLPER